MVENKDSARSWLVVTALAVAISVAYVDRVLLSVATPSIIREMGLDASLAGVLLAAFFWSYTLMQMPAGWLLDRFGTRNVMAFAYAFWSLSCLLVGFSTSFAGLVLCRLGLGAGEAPAYPAGYRLTSIAFTEKNRAMASAVYSEGSKIGPAIGAPLAAWLITTVGWREMFLVVAATSLVWIVPWVLLTPSSSREVGHSAERPAIREWLALLSVREIWGAAVGYFGYLYVFYVYVTWLPGYLILERHFSVLKAGWYASIPFVIQLVCGLAGAWASDRYIEKGYSATVVRKVGIGVGLLVGLAIVPAGFVSSGELAMVCFAISLAGLGVAVPNMLAIPAALAPENRGGIVGAIQNTGGNLGGVLAPIVTGGLYDLTHSFTAALLTSGAMLLVCAIGYLVIIPRIETVRLGRGEPIVPSRKPEPQIIEV
jgi:MFS transporter, ACS family, D-galactonate transporter